MVVVLGAICHPPHYSLPHSISPGQRHSRPRPYDCCHPVLSLIDSVLSGSYNNNWKFHFSNCGTWMMMLRHCWKRSPANEIEGPFGDRRQRVSSLASIYSVAVRRQSVLVYEFCSHPDSLISFDLICWRWRWRCIAISSPLFAGWTRCCGGFGLIGNSVGKRISN